MLAIPATSAKCERVFLSCKLMITDRRTRLASQVVEAAECLRDWRQTQGEAFDKEEELEDVEEEEILDKKAIQADKEYTGGTQKDPIRVSDNASNSAEEAGESDAESAGADDSIFLSQT